MIPTLTTDRLILRAPKLADFEHWAAFFASPRSIHERGMMERSAAWRVWASDVAVWQLRGEGGATQVANAEIALVSGHGGNGGVQNTWAHGSALLGKAR